MDPLERIRSIIEGFAGYGAPGPRRLSDEQIRAFVGEALAQLPSAHVDALESGDRAYYDRVLLRCEFINQGAFRTFDLSPTPERIEAILLADLEVIDAASTLAAGGADLDGVLARLCDAFDKRDAAMQKA